MLDLADHIRREISVRLSRRRLSQTMGATARCRVRRPRRVRRVMGENRLLAPHRVGRNQEKTHDGTIVTDKVNEMGNGHEPDRHHRGRAGLCFRRCRTRELRNHRHSRRAFSDRFEALEPVRQGVYRCFGSIAPGVARAGLPRHDHGSNYMSGDFQSEIKCLGIEASPSFVREPEGNGVAERFIR